MFPIRIAVLRYPPHSPANRRFSHQLHSVCSPYFSAEGLRSSPNSKRARQVYVTNQMNAQGANSFCAICREELCHPKRTPRNARKNCLVVWDCHQFSFPISRLGSCHHPNWRSHIFQRAGPMNTNHQPENIAAHETAHDPKRFRSFRRQLHRFQGVTCHGKVGSSPLGWWKWNVVQWYVIYFDRLWYIYIYVFIILYYNILEYMISYYNIL